MTSILTGGTCTRAGGRVHVPPVRIDVTGGNSQVHTISTATGPELCAGKVC